ncbi:hypothetical protein BJX76DRAFT_353047 [Aspergillus varians]
MDPSDEEIHRREVIDRVRQDILDRTTITFLPRRQAQFIKDYADLPEGRGMTMRDRIKLIPDDYRRKFLRRVEVVVQHAIQAEIDRVSEFNWEADAWRDILEERGMMIDYECQDKREYNYTATVVDPLHAECGQDTYMGKRIPDITFGLSSYHSADPEDEGVDERERRIRRSLQQSSLRSSVWNFDGDSVIADGKWGWFANLETRKSINYPKVFPLFGFTSSGSTWRIYVGYLPICVKEEDPSSADDPLCDEDSHMKLIWRGTVYKREHAGELLDMIDQIHEYAVTTRRLFVANHLQSWGRLNLLPLPRSRQESEMGWHQIKSNTADVRKRLRDKKGNHLLTDDDIKRASLDAKLKEYGKDRSSLPGDEFLILKEIIRTGIPLPLAV